MGRLIKMDFHRLFLSKVFWISSALLFGLQALIAFVYPIMMNWANSVNASQEGIEYEKLIHEWKIPNLLSSPFYTMMTIILFVAVVSFCYADLANGFIKNIAGQIPNKGYTAASKFIVVIFLVIWYTILAIAGYIIGKMLCPDAKYVSGGDYKKSLMLLAVQTLLLIAMCTVILFVVTALRSKTLGSVLGVIMGLGAFTTVYMLLDMLLSSVFEKIAIENYAPSALYASDLSTVNSAAKASAVAIVYIVVFLILSVRVFKERDVR